MEHGTMANADLYLELKPLSRNRGTVDYAALIARRNPLPVKDEAASFDLFRIGDAVESRNIHAAIYDALRYCSLL